MAEIKRINEEDLANVSGGVNNKTLIAVSYKEHSWSRQIIEKYVVYSEIENCDGNTIEEKLGNWCKSQGYIYQGYKIC